MFSHLFVAEEKTVPNPVADVVETIVSEVVNDSELVAKTKEVVADAKEVVADAKEVVADAKEVVADVAENMNKCGVNCVIM